MTGSIPSSPIPEDRTTDSDAAVIADALRAAGIEIGSVGGQAYREYIAGIVAKRIGARVAAVEREAAEAKARIEAVKAETVEALDEVRAMRPPRTMDRKLASLRHSLASPLPPEDTTNQPEGGQS